MNLSPVSNECRARYKDQVQGTATVHKIKSSDGDWTLNQYPTGPGLAISIPAQPDGLAKGDWIAADERSLR